MPVSSVDWERLLAPETPRQEWQPVLQTVGFADWEAAADKLRALAAGPVVGPSFAACLPTLVAALSSAASPDATLINFERFVQSDGRPAALYREFADEPRLVEVLIRLFVGSQFLAEILIANPSYLNRVVQHRRIAELKSREQFYDEAQTALEGLHDEDAQLNALRKFQRWELLRIGACDSFGLSDLKTITVQLSLLADALVQSCLTLAAGRTETDPAGFAVLALGKLGGEELNYSSDIDLVFVAQADAQSYWPLGQRLIRGLVHPTSHGFLYRVDMRLRPWGQSGALVASTDGYLDYLRQHAMLWEKQALLKARVIAGDFRIGRQFLQDVQPFIFTGTPEAVRDNIRSMKQKIEADLQKKGRIWGEVKSGAGSIRDVEFVVQYLQLLHGGTQPDVRTFNTLDALVRLADFHLIQADEYRVLTDGYIFLRNIEHSLQLLHNKQHHNLPTDRQELKYLARRLDYSTEAEFLKHYERHGQAIRRIYRRYLGDRAAEPSGTEQTARLRVARHLARLKEDYANAFSPEEIERHAILAERLSPQDLVQLEAEPGKDDAWRVTVVAYDYLGELSILCGLLFAYGCNILDAQIFTYGAAASAAAPETARLRRGPGKRRRETPEPRPDVRPKIVDVFTVKAARGALTADDWRKYAEEAAELLRLLHAGQQTAAQGELVKRVVPTVRALAMTTADPGALATLSPVSVEIDNDASAEFTVLTITSLDTIGFLYELTNSLALNGIYISQVLFKSYGDFAYDVLYVTDSAGRKITGDQAQRELRAAIVLTKHFTHLLPRSPNPEAALLHFREFVSNLFQQPNWPDELTSLERPEVLDALAKLLGVSDFLWNDFLRMQHANLFPIVRDIFALGRRVSQPELAERLARELSAVRDHAARLDVLNAFKDREMFRVDMRHILGTISEFGQFSDELSDVAEVVLEAFFTEIWKSLEARYGKPRNEAGGPSLWTIAALGKCGGRELGYASDIELMVIYEGPGTTSGPEPISTSEFFVKFVEELTHAIQSRHEGVFRIDLRLRPYGQHGPLAVSLEAFRAYFSPEGPAWPYERQALVKLRPMAGDPEFGDAVVALRDSLIYLNKPFDVGAMRGMRERQLRQLVTAGTINAKFSPGGLVDVEYLVQGLQITYGHLQAALRSTNTLRALDCLLASGLISGADGLALKEAYIFHRRLIDGLRVVRGDAKDLTVPAVNSEQFEFLARRLGYTHNPARLRTDLLRHSERVLEINHRLLPKPEPANTPETPAPTTV